MKKTWTRLFRYAVLALVVGCVFWTLRGSINAFTSGRPLVVGGIFRGLRDHPRESASAVATTAQDSISPQDAKNYIGKAATVRGAVDSIHESRNQTTLLDMGGAYPRQAFTIVSFRNGPSLTQLAPFVGKTISVHGTIKEYQGKPEIILTRLDQISN